MPKALKVLILEDSPIDAELMAYELRKAGYSLDWRRVNDSQGYIHSLSPDLDLILADFHLPQFDAMRALDILQQSGQDIPFIVVSGAMSEEVAVDCMKRGASDYLLKDRLARLGQAAMRALDQKKLRVERHEAEIHIRRLNDVLWAVRNVDKLIVRERDPEKLLSEACNILHKARGYSVIWIGLVDPGNKCVSPVASAGVELEYILRIQVQGAQVTWDDGLTGMGSTGTAIRTLKPDICHDVAADPRYEPWKRYFQELKLTSSASVPINIGSRIFGALSVYSNQPYAFDDEEVSLLQELACDLAFALVGIEDEAKRRTAEEALYQSLREKEVMLKEIHHRVKNNLQVIASLLNIQSRSMHEKEAMDVLKECQNRVRSMALIHESLYRSEDLARVNFADYIRSLMDFLSSSFRADAGTIRPRLQLCEVFLSIEDAIPCGLIVNELVSNCLKHAFPGQRRGEIDVELRGSKEGQVTLIVRDDGIGLPGDLDLQNVDTMGLKLVTALTGQIKGRLELSREKGTQFTISFQA